MKIFYTLAVKLAALMLSVSAAGAVYSIDADWRFTKAPKTIPLSQAKASVETNGVKVEDPAFDDSARVEVLVEESGARDIRRETSSKTRDASLATSHVSCLAHASDAGKVFPTALEGDVYENAPQPTRVVSPETSVLKAECRASGLVFWSPDTPHLYDVVVSLVGEDGTVLDTETIRTGFREVKYDAVSGGLKINGKNTWLTGYAQRSTDEWAAIGVAPDWLQDYDAELIRQSNANFVRWMHVAPKPAPVRAFDKFGIVNAASAGDKEGDVSGRAWAQRMEAASLALELDSGGDTEFKAAQDELRTKMDECNSLYDRESLKEVTRDVVLDGVVELPSLSLSVYVLDG